SFLGQTISGKLNPKGPEKEIPLSGGDEFLHTCDAFEALMLLDDVRCLTELLVTLERHGAPQASREKLVECLPPSIPLASWTESIEQLQGKLSDQFLNGITELVQLANQDQKNPVKSRAKESRPIKVRRAINRLIDQILRTSRLGDHSA